MNNQSYSSYNFPPVTDLAFPTEWDENDQTLFGTLEDPYGVSTSEAETSDDMADLEQWRTGKMMMNTQEDFYFDDDQDMQDDIGPLYSQPLEELFNNALYLDNDEDFQIISEGGFLDPLQLNVETTDYGDDSSTASIGLPLEERYKATLEKLQASMKRSQETRNCLTMKTETTESYERLGSVKELMASIATSSNQVQKYVTSIQRPI